MAAAATTAVFSQERVVDVNEFTPFLDQLACVEDDACSAAQTCAFSVVKKSRTRPKSCPTSHRSSLYLPAMRRRTGRKPYKLPLAPVLLPVVPTKAHMYSRYNSDESTAGTTISSRTSSNADTLSTGWSGAAHVQDVPHSRMRQAFMRSDTCPPAFSPVENGMMDDMLQGNSSSTDFNHSFSCSTGVEQDGIFAGETERIGACDEEACYLKSTADDESEGNCETVTPVASVAASPCKHVLRKRKAPANRHKNLLFTAEWSGPNDSPPSASPSSLSTCSPVSLVSTDCCAVARHLAAQWLTTLINDSSKAQSAKNVEAMPQKPVKEEVAVSSMKTADLTKIDAKTIATFVGNDALRSSSTAQEENILAFLGDQANFPPLPPLEVEAKPLVKPKKKKPAAQPADTQLRTGTSSTSVADPLSGTSSQKSCSETPSAFNVGLIPRDSERVADLLAALREIALCGATLDALHSESRAPSRTPESREALSGHEYLTQGSGTSKGKNRRKKTRKALCSSIDSALTVSSPVLEEAKHDPAALMVVVEQLRRVRELVSNVDEVDRCVARLFSKEIAALVVQSSLIPKAVVHISTANGCTSSGAGGINPAFTLGDGKVGSEHLCLPATVDGSSVDSVLGLTTSSTQHASEGTRASSVELHVPLHPYHHAPTVGLGLAADSLLPPSVAVYAREKATSPPPCSSVAQEAAQHPQSERAPVDYIPTYHQSAASRPCFEQDWTPKKNTHMSARGASVPLLLPESVSRYEKGYGISVQDDFSQADGVSNAKPKPDFVDVNGAKPVSNEFTSPSARTISSFKLESKEDMMRRRNAQAAVHAATVAAHVHHPPHSKGMQSPFFACNSGGYFTPHGSYTAISPAFKPMPLHNGLGTPLRGNSSCSTAAFSSSNPVSPDLSYCSATSSLCCLPITNCPFDYIMVLDFEATCEEITPPNYQYEIIEFPVVLVDVRTQQVISEFHRFVRPRQHTQLSEFCQQLTGITQSQVDNASLLDDVLVEFEQWYRCVVPREARAVFATDGPMDLREFMYTHSFLRHGVRFPRMFFQWVDVKRSFAQIFQCQQGKIKAMMDALNCPFEGRLHSGLDDARNIARIVIALLQHGCSFCEVPLSRVPYPSPSQSVPPSITATPAGLAARSPSSLTCTPLFSPYQFAP